MSKSQKLGIIAVMILFAIAISSYQLFEDVEANEIVIIRYPGSSDLQIHTEPGFKLQLFGRVDTYPKSMQFWFDPEEEKSSQPQKTRFSDAADAKLFGSHRVIMPTGHKHLKALHYQYGSPAAVRRELIKPVTQKVLFNVGPLMTSQQSYQAMRPALLNYSQDMLNGGVYKTISKVTTVKDDITGEEKSHTFMEIVRNSAGEPKRHEKSKLAEFGIVVDNFSLRHIGYGEKVQTQIDRQRDAQMEVQSAIVEAKKAEQRALTVEQEGLANAAEAKWQAEVVKARAVTEAEQRREVAALDKDAAGFEKQKQILLGQGEAERKRLVMTADGALQQKLNTYENVQKFWADAWAKNGAPIVPTINSSGETTGGNAALNTFLQLQNAKAAADLNLDLKMRTTK